MKFLCLNGGMVGYKIQGTKVVSRFPVRPTPGERRLVFSLQRYFDPRYIMVDAYFPQDDERKVASAADLVQIDVIAVDKSGIYVFESKDYSGWIYGHGERKLWTQVLNFGKEKHQFYNPILQNTTHVKAVQTVIGDLPVHSVVVFGREATLKVVDGVPDDCLVCTQVNLGQVLRRCQNADKGLNAEEVWQELLAGQVNPTGLVRAEHIGEVEAVKNTMQKRCERY